MNGKLRKYLLETYLKYQVEFLILIGTLQNLKNRATGALLQYLKLEYNMTTL